MNTEFEDPVEIKVEIDPASLAIETEIETKTEFDLTLTNAIQSAHHYSEELILPNCLSSPKHEIKTEVDPLAMDSEEIISNPVKVKILTSSSDETEEQEDRKRAKKVKVKTPDSGRSSSSLFFVNLLRQNFDGEKKRNLNSNKNNDDEKHSSCSEATCSQTSVKDAGLQSLSLSFTCFECLQKFPTKPALKSHIDQNHAKATDNIMRPLCKRKSKTNKNSEASSAPNAPRFECPANNCNEVFFSPFAIDHHIKSHKVGPGVYFTCYLCPETFLRGCFLKDHKRFHVNIGRFKCHLCSFQCDTLKRLKQHLLVHKDHEKKARTLEKVCENEEEKEVKDEKQDASHSKKKFTCDICEVSYSEHSGLMKHIKNRAKNAPLKCTKCPKQSCTVNHWAYHRNRTHGTFYKCVRDGCVETFLNLADRKKHMKKFHGKLKFECAECKTSYKYALGLQLHLQEYHGEWREAEKEMEAKLNSILNEKVSSEPELRIKQEAETVSELESKPGLDIKREIIDSEYQGVEEEEQNSGFALENIVIKQEDIKVEPDMDFFLS